MKNSRSFNLFLMAAVLLVSHFANAQTLFREGYVISLKNDTLFGEIDYRGDIFLGEKCVFKSKNSETITEYKPDDILAYRFKDDRFFVAKTVKDKKVFLEYLIRGKVSVYYLRNSLTDRYFIEKEGEKLSELPYEEKIVYGKNNDGKTYLSTSNMHKIILKGYMNDVPELQSKIDKMAKPGHTELIKLSKDYHNSVCKGESCIIYKKKAARINVNLEIVGGVLKYGAAETYIIKENYNRFGLLAHFRLPRVNEKLYLRTGLLYSRLKIPVYSSSQNKENTDFNFFKIPMQLEYIYPKGRIKPVFAYGFSLFSFATVDFMAGLNVQVSEKIALGLNYEVGFIPNAYLVVVPSIFSSQSALVGLKVKL